MEQLHAELSHLLGERLSYIECANGKVDAVLWALYDSQGNPVSLMTRSLSTSGRVRQPVWKATMLTRGGTIRMPTAYGVTMHEERPGPGVLLLEQVHGVSVEAPARTPKRWERLKDQIIEALLAWHRRDSHDCVNAIDNTQENFQPSWYRQHVGVLWITLNQLNNTGLTMQNKRILFRTCKCLPALFEGFSNNCALTHDGLCLRSMLKDSCSDQLLTMIRPGLILRASRKYELFRLVDNSLAEDLFWSYLQRASVMESSI